MTIESALLVLIPEAEALVESFRNQYDPSAAVGVPAHVTVIYPFKPPRELTTEVVQRLEELFSTFPGFAVYLTESRQFPGVLYLSPEPSETFRLLTESVTKRFPETPPYGGQFSDVVPHLTVAQISEPDRLDEIAAEFEREARDRLPIQASVKEIALMDNESGSWKVRVRFPLGANTEAG